MTESNFKKSSIKQLLDNIRLLEKKNNCFLHLTANENQMSQTANSFLSSKLSERYYFGKGEKGVIDMGFFTALGLKEIRELIVMAENALKDALHASIVNIKCLSGIHNMINALLSVSRPGDTIMTIREKDGGHFATKIILERIGRKQIYASYDRQKLNFNIEKTSQDFKKNKAKILYLDALAFIAPINLKEIRETLGKKAIVIYDASHTLGLIIGQEFQQPLLEGADIITANTHKTFPGPQKGLMAFKNKNLGEKVISIMDSGLYSSSHTHHLISLAITLLEMKQYGCQYAKQIIANSQSLGQALCNLGFTIRRTPDGDFSKNHQLHIFIDNKKDRIELYRNLVNNYISTNFIGYPGERLYIRIGIQEVTRRGMKEPEMKKIASFLNRALKGENIKKEILLFNSKFNKISYSFDHLNV